MEDTTLIQIEDIKNVTSISDNIEVDQLSSFLYNAQLMYIQPIVGSALYTDLITIIESGGTKYDTLINDYILYGLSYATFFSYIPFGHMKLQKKGLILASSTDSTNASMDEFSMYSQRVESTMTFYLRRLTEYLDDNKELYPLYKSGDQIKPQNSTGLFLGF